MTTQPSEAGLPAVAEDLARLFHRTYQRCAPPHRRGVPCTWEEADADYRQGLVDTFADMELALRPGRCVVELTAGQRLILLLSHDAPETALAGLQETVQQWMPGNDVRVLAGVSQAVVVEMPAEDQP